MKITIDTKEDSHEEIKKIIKMLSSLVGGEVMTNQDVFESDQKQTPEMFNMFSNPHEGGQGETKKEKEKSTDVDLGIPKIEEYD